MKLNKFTSDVSTSRLFQICYNQETSFAALYSSYYLPTHRYGMRMLNDTFTIDNVVQEAFFETLGLPGKYH